MKQEAIKKMNKMGQIGQILALIAKIILIIGIVGICAATIFTAFVPEDFVKVTLGGTAKVDINLDAIGVSLSEEEQENINKPEIMFDSVDSTAWLSGARFGTWYYVKHGKLVSKSMSGKGLTRKQFNDNNLKVWIDKQKELYHNH